MSLIFIFTYIIWGITEILINRIFISKSKDEINKDKNSLSLIWFGIIGSIGLGIYVAFNYNFSISTHYIIKYIGLAFIFIGIILRLIIIKSLGDFFTADVTIKQNHQLKIDGFYKYLRHPSYAASLLSFIGLGISLNNWVSLLIITFTILKVFLNRIKVEEDALIEFFGQNYINYKKSTKALIPYIY